MTELTQAKTEEALGFLAKTDAEYGTARGRVKGLEYRLKVQNATAYLAQKDGPVAEKEARSLIDPAYTHMVEEYENSVAQMETLAAQRKRAELTIECWRTVESSRRRGNIT